MYKKLLLVLGCLLLFLHTHKLTQTGLPLPFGTFPCTIFPTFPSASTATSIANPTYHIWQLWQVGSNIFTVTEGKYCSDRYLKMNYISYTTPLNVLVTVLRLQTFKSTVTKHSWIDSRLSYILTANKQTNVSSLSMTWGVGESCNVLLS